MTEQAPEDFTGGDDGGWSEATAAKVTYPEHPDNPHEAPLSVNFKPGGTPQLTVRGRTVAEHMALLQEVESSGLLGVIASVNRAFGGQGGAPQAQGFPQQTAATPPPFGPNVSVPQAPGYQGPPVQQQPAPWGAQQPSQQWGGNGGGQQQGGRKQYPAPQGWYKLNVPYPGGTDTLHAVANQAGVPKGQPNKGGMYNFWGLTPSGQPGKAWYCSPQVVQAFAQFNPMAA